MLQKAVGSVLLAALAAAAAGCSASSETVPVTGTVTYNGKPAERAEVLFLPKNGRPASAVTDSAGRFTLSTLASEDGALPGEHSVTICEHYAAGKAPPPPGMGEPLPSRFPQKYTDPAQSPFRATVERGGKNDFTFEMTD